ncbi:MAG: OmpH family outer membrane protein [Bacteroidota bacterium]
MKIRITFFLLLLVGMLGNATAQEKIGYANLELILAYLPETQDVNKKLTEYRDQLSKKLESKRSYFQVKFQEANEKQQAGASEQELQVLSQELQKLQAEVQQEAANAEQLMAQRQGQLMQPILDKLQGKIKDLASEKGYTFIFNSTASGSSVLLHGVPGDEVSKDLLVKMGVDASKLEGEGK